MLLYVDTKSNSPGHPKLPRWLPCRVPWLHPKPGASDSPFAHCLERAADVLGALSVMVHWSLVDAEWLPLAVAAKLRDPSGCVLAVCCCCCSIHNAPASSIQETCFTVKLLQRLALRCSRLLEAVVNMELFCFSTSSTRLSEIVLTRRMLLSMLQNYLLAANAIECMTLPAGNLSALCGRYSTALSMPPVILPSTTKQAQA